MHTARPQTWEDPGDTRQLRFPEVDGAQPTPPHLRERPARRKRPPRRKQLSIPWWGFARPKTRADCIDGPRPCPWLSCRHHALIDVSEETGTIVPAVELTAGINNKGAATFKRMRAIREGRIRPNHKTAQDVDAKIVDALFDGRETCTLDVADAGEHTRPEIAEVLRVSDEEIRRRETSGGHTLRHGLIAAGVDEEELKAMFRGGESE